MERQLWLASTWNSPWGTLKVLLGTHKKWFTMVGALIVFITFVVKERVREEIKEELDSYHSVVNVFTIRNESQIRGDELAPAELALWSFKGPMDKLNPDKALTYPGPFDKEMSTVFTLKERAERSFANLEEFISKLPMDPSLSDRLTKLRHLKQVTDNDFEKVLNVNGDKFASYTQKDLKEATGLLQEAGLKAVDLGRDTLDVERDTMKYAKELIEKDESRLRRATRWSYILFAGGWVIGVVGKIFGADVAQGE